MRHQALILFIASFFLLGSCARDSHSDATFSVIPDKAVALIQINDLGALLTETPQSQVYQALAGLPLTTGLQQKMTAWQSLLPEGQRESQNYKGQKLLGALALSGAQEYRMLWIVPGGAGWYQQSLVPALRQKPQAKRPYAGVELLRFNLNEETELYLAVVANVLLMSESKMLVEQGIRQQQASFDFRQNQDFKALYTTVNQKDPVNIWVHYDRFSQFLGLHSPPRTAGLFQQKATWGAWDVYLAEKEMVLSGISHSEQDDFLAQFRHIQEQPLRSEGLIPANAGLAIAYTFQNYGQFFRQMGRVEQQSRQDSFMLQAMDTELGLLYQNKEPVGYWRFREESQAEALLEGWADTLFIEGFRAQIIRRMAQPQLLKRYGGSLQEGLLQPYFARVGKNVLFADELAALKSVLSDILDGKTLAQSEGHAQFKSRLPARAHIHVLATNPQALALMPEALLPTDGALVRQQEQNLQQLSRAALQITVKEEGAFSSLYLYKAEKPSQEVVRRWTTTLEGEPRGEPQFLKNHRNGTYDIALQDADHRLYLLDYRGNVLWKTTLDGPILGGIHQVDRYRNNKLQMVLNTRQTLYMIDRLGRPVDGFPVSLPDSATAPMGVFDYDGARRYRLVVPCGKKLYNYTIEGEMTPGWQFKAATDKLISQPQFFSVKDRDIIVCLAADGKLYQLNRRGEERFVLQQKINELQSRFFLKAGPTLKESQLLANSTSGQIYVLSPYSKVDTIQLEKGRPADHFLYFDDRYIFSSKNHLLVKDENHPFAVTLDGPVSHLPKVMLYQNRFYLGAYSRAAEEIRLFNGQGKLLPGFPVFAQGPFDMGSLERNGRLDVVTYRRDGTVICYGLL